MNNDHHTAVTREDKENNLTITASSLIRWAGLSAVVAGIIFAGIQPIHPPDVLASVNTTAWSILTPVKTVMALLFLLGITGLYARQVKQTGWLGLVGYLVFSLCWSLELGFIFAEAFVIPPLASTAPKFVEGFFGIVNGHPTQMNLGLLPALYAFMSITYLFGGLLFGIASFRAGILPRWAGGLLAVTAVLTPWLHCSRTQSSGLRQCRLGSLWLVWAIRFGLNGARTPRKPCLARQAQSWSKPNLIRFAENGMAWTSGLTTACRIVSSSVSLSNTP